MATGVWLLAGVDHVMSLQVRLEEKLLSAIGTNKVPLSVVKNFMFPHIIFRGERFVTFSANPGQLFNFMNLLLVNLEVVRHFERVLAPKTFKGSFFLVVSSFVFNKLDFKLKIFFTDVALKILVRWT